MAHCGYEPTAVLATIGLAEGLAARPDGRAARQDQGGAAAPAADYDAIHLTVGGYLTTAGHALPVKDARTLLAGCNPDETYWLADILAATPPTRWVHDGWTQTDWRAA